MKGQVRLAEIVAALSLGIDLGFGQPMEHVLRQCLIGMRLAELTGLDERQRVDVYYTALLVNVGCHTDAHEQAKWFGDDIALKADKYVHRLGSFRSVIAGLGRIGEGRPPLHRVRIGLEFAISGHREVDNMIDQHAAMARQLAEQLGLPMSTREALAAAYEQWNGHGWPGKLRAEQIPMAARIAQLSEFLEVAYRVRGIDAAAQVAREGSGSQFDPLLCDLVVSRRNEVFETADTDETWNRVIASEPQLAVPLDDETFDAALRAVATFTDLKSPYSIGHSLAVTVLAESAASIAGLDPEARTTLRRAALLHDIGRLGVSNAIWDRPAPLGLGDWERVRMYPYLTERMLSQAPELARIGSIAGQHAERLDGSGYPRGLAGASISRSARLLAAADVYQALREPRAYRPAFADSEAASQLRAEVKAGRLDADSVDAVLAAVGHRVPTKAKHPAGLTSREVDVLRLLARGSSNKDIATQLVVTPKTVGKHVEHIYTKIGASSRAAAGLFAVRYGLLPEDTENA
ncbi:HD domain-containing phosphohydrolase [Smaragdicoccus niigatensis]|uniref:HD domain-containing phosphohydrolase n=1 Tax=Smaragdicoccus niigatensis TaxID=359359 RepID=UPI00036DBFD0|nr:HD domain-containing phosphohydrolase [Smaragdicoccus niigatensis]